MTYGPIVRQGFGKHIPAGANARNIGRLLLGNDAENTPRQQSRLCFLRGPYRGVILKTIGSIPCEGGVE
jgi:hypothetical protein